MRLILYSILVINLLGSPLWAAGNGAVALVSEPTFRFDPVLEGEPVSHEFTIKNPGTTPLKILNLKSG